MQLLLKKVEVYQKIDAALVKGVLSPKEFQKVYEKLGLSERQLYRYLKEMENLGAPVGYSPAVGGITYLTNKRLVFKLNTDPKISPDSGLYKHIQDRTLKKIKLFNIMDEIIFSGKAGSKRDFFRTLNKKHKVDRYKYYPMLEALRKMGSPYMLDKNKVLVYPKGKRFNFILELQPLPKKR